MSKTRKFDKKTAVTFSLVNRSQQDPLINYEDAPQSVMVEKLDPKKRKEEQRKFGVYYDDDYDYLQHLKGVQNRDDEYQIEQVYDKKKKKFVRFDEQIRFKDELEEEEEEDEDADDKESADKLKLPSSLFESGIKESVGMLNKGAVPVGFQPDMDPEIIMAMDEDFNFDDPENQLDDDFVIQAQEGQVEKVNFEDSDDEEDKKEEDNKISTNKMGLHHPFSDQVSEGSSHYGSEDDDKFTFRSLGSKSQFTSYSMSSSIMRRNQGLTSLDEQFENFYLKDYADDTEIGDMAADLEEEEEGIGSESDKKLLQTLVKEGFLFEKDEKVQLNTDVPKDIILKIAERQEAEASDEEETEEVELMEGMGKNDQDSRWDCESILSTYSNLYNHPKLICEQKPRKLNINTKTGIPVVGSQLSAKALKQLDSYNMLEQESDVRSVTSMISQLTVRNEEETAEERRQRKKNLKEYMRERRLEKKLNKEAFKNEHLRQQKEFVHNRTVGAMKMV